MTRPADILADPIAVIDQLDVVQIAERLEKLEREQDALKVLLRAAAKRQRQRDSRRREVSGAK